MSFHDRGVWFEILCLMHESEDRGRLVLAGKPIPDEIIAKYLGISRKKLKNSLQILLEFGVAFRDESGALCNRRMIRDEQIRRMRKEIGGLGGNPILVNQKDNQTANQKGGSSSSFSSSSSTSVNKKPASQGGKAAAVPDTSPSSTSDKARKDDPVQRRIWRDGRELLIFSGLKEDHVGSLLGRWAQDYGRTSLAQAIAAAQAANPPNPKNYIGGILRGMKNGSPGTHVGKWDGKPDPPPRCEKCVDLGWIEFTKDGERVLCDCGQPVVKL